MPVRFLLRSADAPGGVARSVLTLAGHLCDGYDVEVVSLFRRRDEPSYPAPEGVRMTYLEDRREGTAAARESKRGLARVLASIPSVLMHRADDLYDNCSVLTDLLLIRKLRTMTSGVLITTRPSFHIIAAERAPSELVVIGQEHMNYDTRRKRLRRSMSRSVTGLDALVLLTQRDHRDFAKFLGAAAPQLRCIPNALPWPVTAAVDGNRSKIVIGAGRLDVQKGFDRLIEAYEPVALAHPDWNVDIYGEGVDRPMLQQMIDERGLTDRIALKGWTAQLPEAMADASVFVLSSRFEGLPMVGIEALGQGLPIVAFDCPRGPRELVRNGENGYLVPDGDLVGFGEALAKIITDDDKRTEMREVAQRDAQTYDIRHVGAHWRGLIDSCVEQRGRGGGPARKRPEMRRLLHSVWVSVTTRTKRRRKAGRWRARPVSGNGGVR